MMLSCSFASQLFTHKTLKMKKSTILQILNTYLALYGESGTWVFASIDVSYSFALQREVGKNVLNPRKKCLALEERTQRIKVRKEKKKTAQAECVYLACQPVTK